MHPTRHGGGGFSPATPMATAPWGKALNEVDMFAVSGSLSF